MDPRRTRGCDAKEGLREGMGEGICQLERRSRGHVGCALVKEVGRGVNHDCNMTLYRKGGVYRTSYSRGDLVPRPWQPFSRFSCLLLSLCLLLFVNAR